MANPTYYIDGLFRQGNAADARTYLGISGTGGVPNGGTTGQVLTKDSNADGDVSWQTPSASGSATYASMQKYGGF